MTEAIYAWIESLVCYFILLTAVMNFLPDNSYKKYIQYYMGLLLILTILSPALQITNIQDEIDSYVSELEEEWSSKEEWEQKAEAWEEEWNKGAVILKGQEVNP